METYLLVLLCDLMQKRVFVVGKESVRHPNLVTKVACQSHDIRKVVGESQSLVPPVLVQVDGHSIVLSHPRLLQCHSAFLH